MVVGREAMRGECSPAATPEDGLRDCADGARDEQEPSVGQRPRNTRKDIIVSRPVFREVLTTPE